jgi:hypothetical protein
METVDNADPATVMISNQPRGNEAQLLGLKGRSLKNIGLKCVSFTFRNSTIKLWCIVMVISSL